MKIIGITGKSGTGKTTLSKTLSKKINAPLISLDFILDEVKENKIVRKFTQDAKYVEEDGHKMMNARLSNLIYRCPPILRIFLILKNLIINRILEKRVKEYEESGIHNLIIEGGNLPDLKIMKQLNFLVLLKSPYYMRFERISRRDDIADKKLVVERDKKFQKGLLKKIKRKIDYTIDNKAGISELEEEADNIINILKRKENSPQENFRTRIKDYNNLVKYKSNNNEKRREKCKDDLQK